MDIYFLNISSLIFYDKTYGFVLINATKFANFKKYTYFMYIYNILRKILVRILHYLRITKYSNLSEQINLLYKKLHCILKHSF